jgi:AraC-like DNA-binding protein
MADAAAGMVDVRAWRPAVPGVVGVLHARFTEHVYPMHSHDSWTLLILDDGAVRYDLDRHEHGALRDAVTLLPPDVPHNGRAATPHAVRKRVVYLDRDLLGADLAGASVDTPHLVDGLLRRRVHQLHGTLAFAGEELEAESRLAFLREQLRLRLRPRGSRAGAPLPVRRTVAHELRDLINARVVPGLSMAEAAAELHYAPTHLIRSFTREFGMAPHQYLTSRRVDLARGLLLDGRTASDAAAASGFYDQSHLARHFQRIVGVRPGRFAA